MAGRAFDFLLPPGKVGVFVRHSIGEGWLDDMDDTEKGSRPFREVESFIADRIVVSINKVCGEKDMLVGSHAFVLVEISHYQELVILGGEVKIGNMPMRGNSIKIF